MEGKEGFPPLEEKKKVLDELKSSVGNCFRCPISFLRYQVVMGEGSLSSRIMIIAQAPNRMEMATGRILTGPSGKVLDRLLAAGGYHRKDLYITNLLKCPLPYCRRPLRAEISSCLPFLRREIQVMEPLILLPLGRYSIKTMLREFGHPVPPRNNEIPFLFGKVFRGGGYFVIPLPHPSGVLYRPSFYEPTLNVYEKTFSRVREILKDTE